MIRNKISAFALAGTFAIGGAGMVSAQDPQQGMGMGMEMGMRMMANCPMMRAVAEGPAAMLEQSGTLDLSSEQASRLESLRDDVVEARQARMASMRELHLEIADSGMGEGFDEATLRDAFRRMGELHAETGMAALRARHEARQVLDANQRDKFMDLRAAAAGTGPMQGMMEMMKTCPMMEGMGGMMEMMKNCPMMKGGMGPGSADGMMDGGQEGVR